MAFLNVCAFLYFQILTFSLGAAIISFFVDPSERLPFYSFLRWLAGFWFLSAFMCLWGISSFKITALSVSKVNIFFWILIMIRYRFVKQAVLEAGKGFLIIIRDRASWFWLFPFAAVAGILFLSALLPPTKIDEISYPMFFTKRAVLAGYFELFYSPYELLSYLAVPIYNIWPFVFGWEYVPALNSFLAYILSGFIFYNWANRHFGKPAAGLGVLVSCVGLLHAVVSPAPGDNALTILLLAVFCMLLYDIDSKSAAGKRDIFLLYALASLAVIVKATSALLVVIVLIFWWIHLLKRRLFRWDHIFPLGLAFLIVIPFLLKMHHVYGSWSFPWLSSGVFDREALHKGIAAKLLFSDINASRSLGGFLTSGLVYFRHEFIYFHPLAWVLMFGGFIFLKKRLKGWFLWSMAALYTVAFFVLSHCFLRFYGGVLAFFILLGSAFCFTALRQVRQKVFIKSVAIFCAWAIVIGIFIYSYDYLTAFFTRRPRADFLRQKVACYDSIQWLNRHLTPPSRVLMVGRGRYYFDFPVEGLDPALLGKGWEVASDYPALLALLKERKITHIMLASIDDTAGQISQLRGFCEQSGFCKLIYSQEEEPLFIYRWNNQVGRGRVSVYSIE